MPCSTHDWRNEWGHAYCGSLAAAFTSLAFTTLKRQRKLQELNKELLKHLGCKIREARDQQNLAQSDVAEKIGKSVATLSQIESGKHLGVSLLTIVDLLRALNVDPMPIFCSLGLMLEWQKKRSDLSDDPVKAGAVSALDELYAKVLAPKGNTTK